jgi:hypothetical protein
MMPVRSWATPHQGDVMLAVIGANRPHLDAIAIYLEKHGLRVATGSLPRPFPEGPLRVLEVQRAGAEREPYAPEASPSPKQVPDPTDWGAAIAVTDYGEPMPQIIQDHALPGTVFRTPFHLAALHHRIEGMLPR